MSTKLYIGRDDSMVYSPATFKGSWGSTASAVTHRLHTERLGGSSSSALSETSATNPFSRLLYRGVSDPLAANVTIAGTLSAILLCRETDAAANMSARLHVWVTQGDSDSVRGTLLSGYVDATEWQVHASQHGGITISAQALSSVNAQAGDRIVIELGYSAANAVTTNYTGSVIYGGDTADATGSETTETGSNGICPYVTFSDTFAFQPEYLYTVNTAAPVTPGATRGTWDDSSQVTDYYLATTKSGSQQIRTVNEATATNPWDVLNIRFVTDELAAQTINTIIGFGLKIAEGGSLADCFPKVHAYVMKPDGTVRGTLIADQVWGTEMSTLSCRYFEFATASIAVSDLDRIVIEIGGRFTNTTASTQTMSIVMGATSADAYAAGSGGVSPTSNTMSGWVRIAQGLLYYTAPPPGFPHSQIVVVG